VSLCFGLRLWSNRLVQLFNMVDERGIFAIKF